MEKPVQDQTDADQPAGTGIRRRRRPIDRRLIAGIVIGLAGTIVLLNMIAAAIPATGYWIRFADAVGWLGVLGAILAMLALIASFATLDPAGFDNTWTRIDKIFSSGGFYFFAGLGLLLYAIHTTQSQLHPSLTFLLAMLGMAIMLFGTGSQAVGSLATSGAPLLDARTAFESISPGKAADLAELQNAAKASADAAADALGLQDDAAKAAALPKLSELASTARDKAEGFTVPSAAATAPSDWKPVKANAAIAGGAAVLTALFGYGVIQFRTDIKDVFGFYDRYVKIRIEACASNATTCSAASAADNGLIPDFTLSDYSLDAELVNGSPLYSIVSGNEVQLLVFSEAIEQNVPIRLSLRRQKENKLVGPEVDSQIDLRISPKRLMPSQTGGQVDPAQECDQYAFSVKVRCGLNFEDTGNRGGQVYAVVYSLNFFRKPDAVASDTVNKLSVNFQ